MIDKGKTKVYFEAERLKYKNVGLYHFCKNLGEALIKESKQDDEISLSIYAPKDCHIFQDNTQYVDVKLLHKYFLNLNQKVDVWHCSYQLSSYIPKSKEIKKLLTVHDLNFLREKSITKQKKYLQHLQRNINLVDNVVCISQFVADELAQHIDLKDKKVSVIYNGNNIDHSIIPIEPIIPALDLSQPFLFFIGAILPKKNLHILPYLLKNNSYNLIIAGQVFDEDYKSTILSLCKKLGVEERVFIPGSISENEKSYLLENCAFFCFPSITEGFGLPVVEAMSFGKPMLISKATSLPEIAGEEAHYFESFEPDYLLKLGARMPNMMQSPEQKEKIIARSKMFSWTNAASEYWKLYKELAIK